MQIQPTSAAVGERISAHAVVFDEPRVLTLRRLDLPEPGPGEVVVDVEWTGISTGTEKLLWSGDMPTFPGMGYPLVPGYETVGRVSACGAETGVAVGDRVFVSGARCFGEIRGLFGGAASRLVVEESKLTPVGDAGEEAVLLALAATAHHALYASHASSMPDLIVGHGVLGRLLARLAVMLGSERPTVWETDERRRAGAAGYDVVDPAADDRRDYRLIVDVSGDTQILDKAMQHLDRKGEIVLAGFYAQPLSFAFAPAFMREASISIAAEWGDKDLRMVRHYTDVGALSLDGLISHRLPAGQAETAYSMAFSDPDCLKVVLDWRTT